MQDHYKMLGIRRDATEKEIKKAFRKLISRFHPDRNGNSEAATTKAQEINEAYEILSDSNSRAKYDIVLREYEKLKAQNTSMGNHGSSWQYATTSPPWAQNKDDPKVQLASLLKEIINQLIKHYSKKK